MSLQKFPGGIWLPSVHYNSFSDTYFGSIAQAIDAQGEKVALIGQLCFPNKDSSKTFSSAGGKIHWRTGATTFATAGTVVRVGLQGASASYPLQPDGTFTVYRDLSAGTDTITATAYNSATMSSGSASLSHGDPVAVVLDMTARAGSDSVTIAGPKTGSSVGRPSCMAYAASAWAPVVQLPCVVIEMDDGTVATLAGSVPSICTNSSTFSASSASDEYAVVFRVPVPCAVDALCGVFLMNSSTTSNCNFILYKNALTAPDALATVTVNPAQQPASNYRKPYLFTIPEVTLTPGVDYALALKATSTGTLDFAYFDLRNAADRTLFLFDDVKQASRADATGAFINADTAKVPLFSIHISKIEDAWGEARAQSFIGI